MVDEGILEFIKSRIDQFETPPRVALSSKFPLLKKPIITTRCSIRIIKDLFDLKLADHHSKDYFEHVVARHQSVLVRKLGNSDVRLQLQKITNLKLAAGELDGVIIPAENVFSLWHIVGRPHEKRGYVKGMLLSNGKVVEGVGGGLCQMANLLFWLFLHGPFSIEERYHHSRDVFPDSGRVLPFGSGATILYNMVDLRMKNISNSPLQLKVWLTDTHLKGQILSPVQLETKYHCFEKNHMFVKKNDQYYRYNEIWREELVEGKVIKTEKVITNFAPVMYEITDEYIEEHDFEVLDLSKENVEKGQNLIENLA